MTRCSPPSTWSSFTTKSSNVCFVTSARRRSSFLVPVSALRICVKLPSSCDVFHHAHQFATATRTLVCPTRSKCSRCPIRTGRDIISP